MAADPVRPPGAGQAAGRAFLARIMARQDCDVAVSMDTVKAQYAAIAAYGAEKAETYARLEDLRQPLGSSADRRMITGLRDTLMSHGLVVGVLSPGSFGT